MSGSTSLVSSTPDFVTGTFGAQDVRLAVLGNTLPGLFASGDFAVSQRAAGANMSVDIAQGRCFVDPGDTTHQGLYLARRTSATPFNTSADGGYTWTAADPTNDRIDLLCIEVRDTDQNGAYTGFKFRLVDGTPSASATHQLETAQWPAIPTGCVPIAAIRIPKTATTITTANITNLNPIGGNRVSANIITTPETTTSATYTRMTSPDFVCAYVPANSRVKYYHEGMYKISVASGTQKVALFINGNQLKAGAFANGAAAVQEDSRTIATFLSRYGTSVGSSWGGVFGGQGATADVTDVTTGMTNAAGSVAGSPIDIWGLPAGWYVFEVRFQTSANTLTVANRKSWVSVEAAA